jgi:hypothetical protein
MLENEVDKQLHVDGHPDGQEAAQVKIVFGD